MKSSLETDDGGVSPPKTQSRVFTRDIAVIVTVTLVTLGLSFYFDAFDALIRLTRMGEHSEIDEAIPAFFALSLSLIWYSRRRRKELEVIIDIRLQLEHRLKELNRTLEEKVQARTEELLRVNRELEDEIRRRKEAEEQKIQSEKLKSVIEMAGTICHELNQPLQAISGNIQLMAMNLPDDPSLVKRVSSIKAQVDRMGDITKKLLGITRYETKSYPGEATIIDIDQHELSGQPSDDGATPDR